MEPMTASPWKRIRHDDQPPEPKSSTTQPLPDMPNQRVELCTSCSLIDFDKISRLDKINRNGVFIKDVGSADISRPPCCPLCQLLRDLAPAKSGMNGKTLQLRAFSSRKSFTGIEPRDLPDKSDMVHLAIVIKEEFKGFLDRNAPNFLFLTHLQTDNSELYVRSMDSASFDLNIARYWWGYCCKNHTKTCAKAKPTPIKSLRVIDCIMRTIVQAPKEGCEFVALSYVWGSPTTDITTDVCSEKQQKRLPCLPNTIEDSIHLTKELGLRYLWVDRYCIDQFNENDKHQQIQQMDLIYSSAVMTIIAGAGEDPTYGLPGVNGTQRKPQKRLRIDDCCITLAHPNSSACWQSCKWAARGWTYQERILSHRRLVFTSTQVSYECDEMTCCESLRLPLDHMHTKQRHRLKTTNGVYVDHPGRAKEVFIPFVCEYYRKELSYPSDILNAMQGIFRVLETASPPIFQLSGVPVLPSCSRTIWNRSLLPSEGPLDTSKTLATERFLRGLTWCHSEAGKRRAQFPSWSWAGWQHGQLHGSFLGADVLGWNDTQVWIEDAARKLRKFPQMDELSDYLLSRDHYATYIHIDAWTISCTVSRSTSGPNYVRSDFSVNYLHLPGKVVYDEVYMSCANECLLLSASNIREKEYVGIFINNPSPDSRYQKRIILLVEERLDYWERVGCFIDNAWWQRIGSYIDQGNLNYVRHLFQNQERILSGWFDNLPKTRRRLRLG